MIRVALLFSMILVAGCADIPRDADGTLERIRADRQFTVGITLDEGGVRGTIAGARDFLNEVERRSGATAILRPGASEPLLTELEEGRIDMVVSQFSDDSPWRPRVTFGPILAETQVEGRAHKLRPALRHGENGWITLVYHAAVAAGGKPE